MDNALIVRETFLPRSRKIHSAAQYVRMSTNYQRYSIENQAAVIAAYALAHGLSIVRTYRDEGESGLRIKNRAGLIQLIEDVSTGQADFNHILVYDISRWGRFQDIDESAHYEFICKKAGIKIAYCAEQFDNDDSMLSSIVKNIKRVMAAEFSRELSAKVHAGACRFARLGYAPGGPSIYGLHRVLVDEKFQSKGVLKRGDRKYLITDHVRFRPGADDEVAVVKWIFNEFLKVKSETAIARRLNRAAIPSGTGGLWDGSWIGRLLRDERYIGNLIYNRRSRKLREKLVPNPPDAWIRSEGCIEPVVELDIFLKAKEIIQQRRPNLSDQEMLTRLRQTLAKKGRLTPTIIDEAADLPSWSVYFRRFGSLRNAYGLIGYTSERNCDHFDTRQFWADELAKLVSQTTATIQKSGGRIVPRDLGEGLRVNGKVNLFFRVARRVPGEIEHYSIRWVIQRRHLPEGWIAAMRLNEDNTSIIDYLLIPTRAADRNTIRFTENERRRLGIERFESSDGLARSVSRRATKPTRVAPTKPARRNKQSRSSRSKRTSHRARR